jgi:hypothetical protein
LDGTLDSVPNNEVNALDGLAALATFVLLATFVEAAGFVLGGCLSPALGGDRLVEADRELNRKVFYQGNEQDFKHSIDGYLGLTTTAFWPLVGLATAFLGTGFDCESVAVTLGWYNRLKCSADRCADGPAWLSNVCSCSLDNLCMYDDSLCMIGANCDPIGKV